MVKLEYTDSYYPLLRKLLREDPSLRDLISLSLERFIKKPFDERLENHALIGRLNGLWAFSVTKKVRVVYRWKNKYRVQVLAIGFHDFVYSLELKNGLTY